MVNYIEAFLTEPAKVNVNGEIKDKDRILYYYKTDYKKNGLSSDDIAEFYRKIFIENNTTQINTGLENDTIFLTRGCCFYLNC